MQSREIYDRLAADFGDAVGDFTEAVPAGGAAPAGDGPRDPFFQVTPARALELFRALRDRPELACDFLQNLTAVDWPKRPPAGVIELVYHLFSYRHRHEVVVKIAVPRAEPRLPSVAGLWKNANWLEREQFDLLGVIFEGHPDLRRLLLPDDWVGHPMRKDYREPAEYRGMATSRPSPLDFLRSYDQTQKPPGPTPKGPA